MFVCMQVHAHVMCVSVFVCLHVHAHVCVLCVVKELACCVGIC